MKLVFICEIINALLMLLVLAFGTIFKINAIQVQTQILKKLVEGGG